MNNKTWGYMVVRREFTDRYGYNQPAYFSREYETESDAETAAVNLSERNGYHYQVLCVMSDVKPASSVEVQRRGF